jgi:hypothetical protein
LTHGSRQTTTTSIYVVPDGMEEGNDDAFQLPPSKKSRKLLEPDPGSHRGHRLIQIHQQVIEDVSQRQRTWLQQRYLSSARIVKAKSGPNSSLSSTWRIRSPRKVRKATLERLQQLRRHRLALAAQLEEKKVGTLRSITDEFSRDCVPHPEMMERIRNSTSSLPSVDATKEESMTALLDCVYQKHPLDYLRQLRHSQCLHAAYRLTGISVVPDHNHFILRFDVGKTSHLCVFDLVTVLDETLQPLNDFSGLGSTQNKKENSILCLRLIQHTLPASVNIQTILQRTTTLTSNGMIRLGLSSDFIPEPDETAVTASLLWSNIVDKDGIMKQLRQMSLQIYDEKRGSISTFVLL